MIDNQTKSLWSHLLGQAMKGPLTGKSLKRLPVVMTDWKSWRANYPESTVLIMSRITQEFKRDDRLGDQGLLIGLVDGNQARAWEFLELRQKLVINDRFGDKSVLAAWDKAGGAAVLYDRNLEGRTLTFAVDGDQIIDQETRSTWDCLQGVATAGSLKGKRLKRLPGTICYGHVWAIFYPK